MKPAQVIDVLVSCAIDVLLGCVLAVLMSLIVLSTVLLSEVRV